MSGAAPGTFERWPLKTAGLAGVAAGWFVVIATVAARIAGARLDVGDIELAACIAIAFFLSGATLLVLEALRTGFGALDSFFREALARSARRASDAAKTTAPPPSKPPAADTIQRRGFLGDRPYVLYENGGVLVETLLGPRRFQTLEDAAEFVGA
jgi:hypothetical protein